MSGEYGSVESSRERRHRPSINMSSSFALKSSLVGGAVGAVVLIALATSALHAHIGETDTVLVQLGSQVSLIDTSALARQTGGSKAVDQVSFEDLSSLRRASAAAAAARGASKGPVPVGHMIHVDMPVSEMQQLKVGSIVKGQVRRPMLADDGSEEFNTLDFTGKVRSLQLITVRGKVQSDVMGAPDEGVVTVKMLSDQFLAPGTSVTGMVAGKIFKGTVTNAPSLDERLDEAEKRARELQPPVCDELCQLNKEIVATEQRIKDYTTSRKMRQEAKRLEERTWHLEHPPPPPETVKIVGNWAGFKFDVPQGPNVYGPRIKEMKQRLSAMQHNYAAAVEPLYSRTRELEKKLDALQGKKNIEERLGELRHELGRMELCMHGSKEEKKACVQSVMKQFKYNGFRRNEADEEEDKEQFVEPQAEEPAEEEGKGDLIPKQFEEEEEEASEKKSITQTLTQHAATSHKAKQTKKSAATGGTWAPGQQAIWQRYLQQTDKMNGIANQADNIISKWA